MLTNVQKTVLETIFNSDLKKIASWGGGTALSEIYLHHRRSDDIDIMLSNLPDNLALTSLTNQIKSMIAAEQKQSLHKMNRFQYIFTWPNQDQLKLEFVYYPFPRLGRQTKQGIIRIESLKDLAASKTLAAYQRQEIKDAYDLFIILKRSDFTLNKLIKSVEQKFGESLDPASLLAKITKSLQIFSDLKPLINDKKVTRKNLEDSFQKEFNQFIDTNLKR